MGKKMAHNASTHVPHVSTIYVEKGAGEERSDVGRLCFSFAVVAPLSLGKGKRDASEENRFREAERERQRAYTSC